MKNDALAVLLLLAAPLAFAQEAPRFSETVDVNLVNVDVIVTDRRGERVRGLTADDFVLLEQGKPQAIVNFAEYAGDAGDAAVTAVGTEASAAAEPPPRQPRTFLIFIDEVALVFSKADFRPALVETLREVLQPGDTGAVITWTRRMNVRQGFTGDIAALEKAIMALPKPGPMFTDDSTYSALREDEEFWRSIALDPRNSGMRGDTSPTASLIRNSLATTAMVDMKSKARAINASMSAMAGAEGRKVLLLVTHHFPRNAILKYQLDLRASSEAARHRDPRYDMRRLIESVAQTANATGFTVYGIYPEGLQASMDTAETVGMPAVHDPPVGVRDHIVLMNETESLQLISHSTGGEYAFGSDVLELLPRVADDLTDYYSLAYRTTSRGTDNRRKITVRAKNRAYTVRARSEVVERTEATRMRDRVSATVFVPIDPGTIPIRVELDGGKLHVRIPISSLATVDKGDTHTGAFTVYLAWNAGGTLSETTKKTQPFTIKASELESAKQGHFTYTVDVRTDPGTRALGVGVLDETSQEFGVVQVPVNLGDGRAREQLGAAGAGLDLEAP